MTRTSVNQADVPVHLERMDRHDRFETGLDEEIRDRFLLQPEAPIILSLPGMSHRTGPRFLAEVGALARFSSPDALAAYAGLTPTLWQSGRSSGTHFLTRRCNLHLRQACWSAALFTNSKVPHCRRRQRRGDGAGFPGVAGVVRNHGSWACVGRC